MENENTSIKRRKVFLVLLYVSILFVAIAIWIASTIARTPDDEAEIRNIDKSGLEINSKLKTTMQKKLYETIKLAYGIKDGKQPIGHIRKETLKGTEQSDGTKVYKFIVDVDDYQVSYSAEIWDMKNDKDYQAFFYCVAPEESKYPNNFCVGYNGQSTIDVTIGNALPLVAKKTRSGYYYDVKVEYKKKSIQPYLFVYASVCNDTDKINEIREDLRTWIQEKGYNPDMYTIEIPSESCTHTGE